MVSGWMILRIWDCEFCFGACSNEFWKIDWICGDRLGSREARFERVVSRLALFHQPVVVYRPEVELYHCWRVWNEDSAR